MPIHILGSALKVLRYKSKLSPKDWLYEAWVITPENRRAPFCCIFEDAPEGFPIGANVSERVVFNGYFLKFMMYEANGSTHRAPVLVGRIGWQPSEPAAEAGREPNLALDAHHTGHSFLRVPDALDLPAPPVFEPACPLGGFSRETGDGRDRSGGSRCLGSIGRAGGCGWSGSPSG